MDLSLASAKPLAATVALAVLWFLEGVIPMFEGRSGRGRHGGVNLGLGMANALVAAALFAGATLVVTEWARARSFGVLGWIGPPPAVGMVLAVLLLDLWQYVWHRLNHQVPFLWRFHMVHHADRDLDATTGLRFHTGEILLSSTARLAVLPLLGLSVGHVLVYETILLPVILFHHSNVRIPEGVDRSLRWLIVTPWMHWVHHSDHQPETDSNYSSILSVWDRIFRSFRLRDDPAQISLGLKGMEHREWATLAGLLAMPFRGRRSEDEEPGSPGRPSA